MLYLLERFLTNPLWLFIIAMTLLGAIGLGLFAYLGGPYGLLFGTIGSFMLTGGLGLITIDLLGIGLSKLFSWLGDRFGSDDQPKATPTQKPAPTQAPPAKQTATPTTAPAPAAAPAPTAAPASAQPSAPAAPSNTSSPVSEVYRQLM